MEDVDILFLFPPTIKASTSYRSFGPPPLGIAYLSAVCDRYGLSVRFHDCNIEKISQKALGKLLRYYNPIVVGISIVTESRFKAFDLFRIVKACSPSIITVAGGPHPTLCTEDTLNAIKDIDIIVRGEGEETLIDLMRAIKKGSPSLEAIKGISYRENGRIIHNSDRPLIKYLDSLPFPAIELLSFNAYNFEIAVEGYGSLRGFPILTSRGCPFRCNFCASSCIWGTGWRFRSPENTISEMEMLKNKYDIEIIWFVDDNFNASTKRLYEFCEKILARGLNIKWQCNIRVDNLKKEHLELMHAAGCISVEFGGESGSQRLLNKMGKKITLSQIKNADRWCDEIGIMTDTQFIVSHPTETYEEAKTTVELMKSLKGKSTLQILKIYPGTEIEEIARGKGILPKDFSWARDKGNTEYFPSFTGEAPLFLDELTLEQATELLTMAWTEVKSFSILYLVKKIIFDIKSFDEFLRLVRVGIPVLVHKIRRRLKREPLHKYKERKLK